MGSGESGKYYTSYGSKRVHHGAIIHSMEGEFTHMGGRPDRLKSGGHGQAAMDLMDKYGIEYNVEKTYSNGVRAGNVPNHKSKFKRSGLGQTWFPKSWTQRDIVRAGEHVSQLKSNKHAMDGETMWGTYKGVRVGVKRTNGQIATVFPDIKQPRAGRRRR